MPALAPEVVAGATMREDPSGSARSINLGATFSLGARERLLLTASHEIAGANPLSTGTASEVAVTTLGLGGEITRRQPGLQRARELLAWVLEARGKLDAELDVRA